MSRSIRILVCTLVAVFALTMQGTAHAQAREEAKLLAATQVLDQLSGQRDQSIPERLLQRAYGVAVIPAVTKVALILGGRRGSGVLVVRDARGRFTNPLFINLTGGSVGWQFGAQETDVVLVFTTRRGIEGIAGGKLTLGAGASVAAGPVGRQAEAAVSTGTEVYAYSQSRGLFIGVALDGTALTIDNKANRNFYGKQDVLPSEIMSGAVMQSSENARRFLAAIATSTGESAAAAPAGNGQAKGGSAATSTPVAPAQTPAPVPSGAKTFPMEDPSPGKEPPR